MIDIGVSWARLVAAAALGVGALIAIPGSAMAVNSNKYCSYGSDPTVTSDSMPGSLLSVEDVKLWAGTTHTASDCYGDFDPGNSSPSNEVAAINEIFGGISGGDQFVYLDKTGASSSPSGLNGVRFAVQTYGGSNGTPGLWTIVWWAEEGLSEPLMIDLAVLLVGGNHSAAYLLSGLLIPFSPGGGIGTFDIQFTAGNSLFASQCYYEKDDDYDRYSFKHAGKDNKYGNKKHKKKHKKHCDKPKQPDLSHLLIAGRIVPTQIPEPSTMALFGSGLVGLWMFSRRRSRKA